MMWLCIALLAGIVVIEVRRRAVLRDLARIARSARRGGDEDAVEEIVEQARRLAGAAWSVLAIAGRGHRLALRALAHIGEEELRERERDIRRGPFAGDTPIWHDTFIHRSGATLLVPLFVDGKKIGFWILGYPCRVVPVGGSELIAQLAEALARTFAESRARSPIDAIDHALGREARLCEAMPYGVFAMSMFGEVRYANTAMRLACDARGIDLDACDPFALVGALAEREVACELRMLATSQAPMNLGTVALSWLGDDSGERLLVGWLLPPPAVTAPDPDAAMTLVDGTLNVMHLLAVAG